MNPPNPGDPFLPAPSGPPMTGGFTGMPYQTGGFPNQFPASPFAVANPTAPGLGRRSMPTIAELFHAFRRRWVLVMMVGGLLGTMFAAGVWMALPSGKHQARALIQMHTATPNLIGQSVNYNENEFDRFKEGEIAKMRRKEFLNTVAAAEGVRTQPLIQMAEDKARSIEGILNTKWESPEILAIMMNGDDANQLKAILTGFVKMYLDAAKLAQTDQQTTRLLEIKEAVKKLSGEINKKQEELVENARKNGTGLNESGMKDMTIQNQILDQIRKIDILVDKRSELQSNLEQFKAEQSSGEYIVNRELLEAALDKHPAVEARMKELEALSTSYKALKEKLVENSESLLKPAAELRKAEAAVQKERDKQRNDILVEEKAKRKLSLADKIQTTERDLKALATQLKDVEARKDQLVAESKRMSEGSVKSFQGKEELQRLLQQWSSLDTERSSLEFGSTRKDRVELVEGAQVYMNYNLKQKMVMAAGAGIIGLAGVMLLISYLEWRNRRVDGVDQVVTELGMRVIGTIPAFPSRASLRSGDAGANQNWRFILNESVNSTRTMLLHTARTQQMQVIMVTSAMQGEGKTSLSSQLATSMATAGLRTLILDFDLRNPSMQKLFDVQVTPGCCEVLLQEVDVSDCVQPTTVPNLWIIPAGQCNHRVIAALAQGHPLEALFNRLRGQFDVIVVDSCPILPVADALLVAQHVDGVVFSILQDVSQLPKVLDASEKLVQLNIPLLGAVVNGIKPDIQAYGYNYVKQLPA